MEQHRYYLGQMDLNIQSPKVWEYYREVLKTLAGYGAKIVRLDAFAYAPKTGRTEFFEPAGHLGAAGQNKTDCGTVRYGTSAGDS